MYAAVCGGGWGRCAESRAFRLESWEESTISFHILCSGSNSITLTSKKKMCVYPDVRISPSLEIESEDVSFVKDLERKSSWI